MQTGVNYPWFDYGWDFGLGPPSWRGDGATPRWRADLDAHLRHFQALDLTVVRWFILGDGLTYGTGTEAPLPDPVARRGWRFTPCPLGEPFLEHFGALLRSFANARIGDRPPIQILPVLLDFHFCRPGRLPVQTQDPFDPSRRIRDPGWVKGGRADALVDDGKRGAFLNHVLDPLLQVSRGAPEVIYAWELINEPDWVTRGWHPSRFARTPIPERAMRAFIQEGQQRVRDAGFRSTVGFASIDTLRTSGITAELNQFHHYPSGRRALEPDACDPRFPGIIGELATADADVWPDLPAGDQRLIHRLRLARRQGYSLAMPWSFRGQDPETDWSAEVERDLKTFADEAQERV